MTAKKIATSLPEEQYEALERARRKLKLRRSTAIQQAIARWLDSVAGDARVEAYVRGYTAQPDDAHEARALTRAWASGAEREDW